ncbi:MAG: RNA polymerase sigma factor [Planctomycetota bacterium]
MSARRSGGSSPPSVDGAPSVARVPAAMIVDPVVMTDPWIREVYPRIHRAAWALTGQVSLADDLAQETFVVALDQWESFGGRSSRMTWLHGILIRLCRKRHRSTTRLRRRITAYWTRKSAPNESPDVALEVAQHEWNESVWAEVAKLPRRQSEAITLRFACEMTYAEIASAVECAEGTAKTRVHHGLKSLRRSEHLQSTVPPTDET